MKYVFRRQIKNLQLWRSNKSFIYNLHPPHIPASGARFTYTFGLGGLAILSTIIAVITGAYLMFYYVPTLDDAHASVAFINSVVSWGALVRSLHYWSAQAMVVTTVLHLARVVYTGGYRPPRDFNWLIGIGLLLLTLLWNFTGFALRWDEESIWALLVGTNLLKVIPNIGNQLYIWAVGDTTLGGAAILRFYSWHVFGLTIPALVGVAYHIWRIRVDGGISHPVPTSQESRITVTRETLLSRELLTTLIAVAVLLLLAGFIIPPLGSPADLSASGIAEIKAPWFFLSIQELLRYLPPLWAGWILPLGGFFLLALIPFFDPKGGGRGVWFASERWKVQSLFTLIFVIIIILTAIAWWR